MNQLQIKDSFDRADRSRASGQLDDAESLYRSLVSGLPRDPSGQKLRVRAYDCLIEVRASKGDFAGAIESFQQFLGSGCATRCDPAFDSMYRDGMIATQTSPSPLRRRDRFYALANLFQSLPPLAGLVAECGCFRGLSSFILCSCMKLADHGFSGKGYRIFDSFEGLSEPQPEDDVGGDDSNASSLRDTSKRGRFAVTVEQVRAGLRAFPDIEFFPGWIPSAFPDEPDARYRFVHIDVDLYQPTRDSLEYFYPRVVPGGTIVCDDYNWPGARKAIEEFCARVNARFSVTPFKQAYIVRRGT